MSSVDDYNNVKEWWDRKKLEINRNLDITIDRGNIDSETLEIMKKLLIDNTKIVEKNIE